MAPVFDDARKAADRAASALTSSGHGADRTPDSLIEIERFFNEQCRDGKPVRRGILSEDLGSRLFAIGADVGEAVPNRRSRLSGNVEQE